LQLLSQVCHPCGKALIRGLIGHATGYSARLFDLALQVSGSSISSIANLRSYKKAPPKSFGFLVWKDSIFPNEYPWTDGQAGRWGCYSNPPVGERTE